MAAPIQKMADVMKEVSGPPLGAKSDEQTKQLAEQMNKIGEYCK